MYKALRWFFKLLSALIALVLIFFIFLLVGGAFFNSPPDKAPMPDEDAMSFDESNILHLEVKNGESSDSVGKRLENAGVIRSRYLWFFLSRVNKEYLKTGTYNIELPASQTQIRSILISGEQRLIRVTIPEGVTLKKTARILEDEGICSAEDFLSAAASKDILNTYMVPGTTMEGYLYPDTYLFQKNFPAVKVVMVMADTFYQRIGLILGEAAKSMSASELNRKIILASIVEREYRVPDEAALMAGVFNNRLEIGMGLQSCATVEYIITEIQGRPHPEVLYNIDLEIRNPYNTYLYRGLPPGPIASPGETALTAAFNPSKTNYLFFRLMDPREGRHYFSRTLDDHIKAGALYLKD